MSSLESLRKSDSIHTNIKIVVIVCGIIIVYRILRMYKYYEI
jgi:hypothetical protein